MTLVLALNIQHGGGQRVGRIARFVAARAPDVAVLTEFRASTAGGQLRSALHDLGFKFQAAPTTESHANTVLVASRLPFLVRSLPGPLAAFPDRLLLADFDFGSLLAAYFPLNAAKVPLFQALLSSSPALVTSPALLVGDFNTGLHYIDESAATFVAADLFAALESHGWLDVWRHLNPSAREFSWYSGAGNGFRIDHVFLSRSAIGRLRTALYDHTSRESRLSDHSALLVELSPEA